MQYPISSLCWQNLPSYFHSTDHCRKRVWFQYIILLYPWNETLSFWGSSSNTKSSHNFTILNVGRSITARNNRRHCMWSIIISYFKMITVKQKADNPPKKRILSEFVCHLKCTVENCSTMLYFLEFCSITKISQVFFTNYLSQEKQ